MKVVSSFAWSYFHVAKMVDCTCKMWVWMVMLIWWLRSNYHINIIIHTHIDIDVDLGFGVHYKGNPLLTHEVMYVGINLLITHNHRNVVQSGLPDLTKMGISQWQTIHFALKVVITLRWQLVAIDRWLPLFELKWILCHWFILILGFSVVGTFKCIHSCSKMKIPTFL